MQVHASLQKSGEMGAVALKYFDQQDADLLLYELRYLEVAIRPAVATYIATQELNPQVCACVRVCVCVCVCVCVSSFGRVIVKQMSAVPATLPSNYLAQEASVASTSCSF